MSKVRIYTGTRFSESAKLLAEALTDAGVKTRLLKREGSKYIPKAGDVIINYGSSKHMDVRDAHIINSFDAVHNAVDKKLTYMKLKEANVKLPEFVFTYEEALALDAPHGMIVRTTMTGHSAQGTFFRPPKQMDEVALEDGNRIVCWQKYIAKNAEYRVHVFGGEVIDVQKKRRRTEEQDDANTYIRNLANGWVYCRNNVELHEDHKRLCISAVEALGLDFGAVDLITTTRGVGFVLEVNSAPGLIGHTLESYTKAISEYVNGME